MYAGITTVELDTLAAEISASMTTKHPDYGLLAARIAISNLHKETNKKFSGRLFYLVLGHSEYCIFLDSEYILYHILSIISPVTYPEFFGIPFCLTQIFHE